MTQCYLTIDDSPSPNTIDMVNFLKARNIPALLFCVGHLIDHYGMDALVYAVQNGYVLGNHAYTHTHFSQLSLKQTHAKNDKTDQLIDIIYQKAGIERPGKFFRFPHMDRGTAGEILNFDGFHDNYRAFVKTLFTDGIRIEPMALSPDLIEKKNKLQDYLAHHDFRQPFPGVTYPWFQGTELEKAKDCMYSFSSSDWMLLNRHRGKWPYKTIEDLKSKITNDPWLKKTDSRAIILMHDKPDPELFLVFKSLVDYFLENAYKFVFVQ